MFDIDVDTLDPVGEFGSAAWCQSGCGNGIRYWLQTGNGRGS